MCAPKSKTGFVLTICPTGLQIHPVSISAKINYHILEIFPKKKPLSSSWKQMADVVLSSLHFQALDSRLDSSQEKIYLRWLLPRSLIGGFWGNDGPLRASAPEEFFEDVFPPSYLRFASLRAFYGECGWAQHPIRLFSVDPHVDISRQQWLCLYRDQMTLWAPLWSSAVQLGRYTSQFRWSQNYNR